MVVQKVVSIFQLEYFFIFGGVNTFTKDRSESIKRILTYLLSHICNGEKDLLFEVSRALKAWTLSIIDVIVVCLIA